MSAGADRLACSLVLAALAWAPACAGCEPTRVDEELSACWPECGDPCEGARADRDGDGFAARACGGDDCDDDDPEINPEVAEAMAGERACRDRVDNDCDGRVDQVEPQCRDATCADSGWCWAAPATFGDGRFTALWVQGRDDVWLAANSGVLLHYDGARWRGTVMSIGGLGGLSAVGCFFGSGEDLWACSTWSQVLRRRDGLWRSLTLPASFIAGAIWGTAPDDVWLTGGSAVQHWDGRAWQQFPSPPGTWTFMGSAFIDLWGSAPDDYWALGRQGHLYHWNGFAWAERGTPLQPEPSALWGAARDDLWAVGASGALHHFDGAGWRLVPSGTTEPLVDVWGASADAVWFVGPVGAALRWDGSAVQRLEVGVSQSLSHVHGSAADDVWAVGYSTVVHWDGQRWRQELALPPRQGIVRAIGGSADDDVWAADSRGFFLHYDGQALRQIDNDLGWVEAIFSFAADDTWAVSGGAVARWDGQVWTRHDPPRASFLQGLWGAAPDDLWACGYGDLLHWDGAGWTAFTVATVPYFTCNDLWGLGASDVWAVGDQGLTAHWDGSAWQQVPTGLEDYQNLEGVWGAASDDVWAVGSERLHWDGARWERTLSTGYVAIRGAPDGQIWAVGDWGDILRWDGEGWLMESSGTLNQLFSVWVSPGGEVWAGGWDTLLRRQP